MYEPPISLTHLKYDPNKPHRYITGMDGCRVCGASWRHILHLTMEDTVTIDKTADLKPAKDDIDEAIEDDGEELDKDGKPLKLKSPTVDKTAVVREKKEE